MIEQNQIANIIIELNKCENIVGFSRDFARQFNISDYYLIISDTSYQSTLLKASSHHFTSEMEIKEFEEKLRKSIQSTNEILSEVMMSDISKQAYHRLHVANKQNCFDLIFKIEIEELGKVHEFRQFFVPFALRFLDITDLENIISTKSDFLRKAVHDLKNPLSNIIGYLSLLTKYIDLGELDSTKMKDDVKHIIRIAEHMTKLVTDLLTIASFQSGKIKLGITQVNIFKLIHSCLAKADRICKKKNVDFKKSIDSIETNLVANFDELRIASAIDELVNNALKFTQNGEIKFKAELENDHLKISVTDYVHDLSTINISDLLTGFTHLHTRTTDGQKPNSFTLLLIRNIIEQHEGELFAKANNGLGATFTICLPLNLPSV